MRKLLITCFVLISLSHQTSMAQDMKTFTARNAVYVELFGTGGVYSLNIDRIILESRSVTYGLRAGAGIYGDDFDVRKLSVGAYGLTGANSHHAEFGVGGVWGNRRNPVKTESPEENRFHFVPTVGYRYQKPTGGLLFRASFTPFIPLTSESPKHLFPWGGLSIGTSF